VTLTIHQALAYAVLAIGIAVAFSLFVVVMVSSDDFITAWRERRPKNQCRDNFCNAFSWDHCTGGRCKYHCDLTCKCVPKGDGRPLKVVDGGKDGGKKR